MSKRRQVERPPVISLVTLGCAKNLVDSERVLGQLAEAGFLIASDPTESDACLVNTCGFIQEARDETAGVLRELHDSKEATGFPKHIVALGCLVERAADAKELSPHLKHADARLGFKDYPRIAELVREIIVTNAGIDAAVKPTYVTGPAESAAKKKVPKSYSDFLISPRLRIGSPHYAYLKIAEGCNNPCRFCAIPRMRGLQVSRPIEKIVEEAREMIATGAKEILLIAQDTTSYGQDLYGKHELAKLLRTLSAEIKDDVWLRLMYAYPKHLTAEMLDALAADPRYCRYIDMPLQHAHDEMLGAMARGVTQDQTRRLLDLIDAKLPGCAVRTTFIVGFPGETQTHVDALRDFLAEGRFTHAGVFMYSTEPLTPAAKLPDALTLQEKQRRRDELYRTQLEVSKKRLAARVGLESELIVDAPAGKNAPKGAVLLARSRSEAPEVDGLVYIKGRGASAFEPGTRLNARIVASYDYDLVAEPLPAAAKPRQKTAARTRA